MDEPLTVFPLAPAGEPPREAGPQAGAPRAALRRRLLRRLLALLTASVAAFTLTTFLLVRYEKLLGLLGGGPGPASVVRTHLEEVNRGELRAAYELFSPHYREQVSFDAYHALVVKHRRIFRLREFHFNRTEQSGGRAVLETRLVAADGERYVARFTLVRADGRWWIDDLRWGAESHRLRIVV